MELKFRWYDKSNNEMITTEDISNGLGGDYKSFSPADAFESGYDRLA